MANTASEIAVSLTQDDIPVKLRCASCNKLVINAFRLPCCDQNVCENCQTSLPLSCPVCMHSPLCTEDCKPNKSLRLTVKAFLKNEEKKRNKELAGASASAPCKSPPAAVTTPLDIAASIVERASDQNDAQEQHTNFETNAEIENAPSSPSSSIEITLEPPSYEERVSHAPEFSRHSQQFHGTVKHNSSQNPYLQGRSSADIPLENSKVPASVDPQPTAGLQGFDLAGMNSFGSMAGNGDFNSMMAQNATGPVNWSGYPNVMSMPGASMDFTSLYPGMFGGFNGQSMGLHSMNGLNMGMAFDGGYGGWANHSTIGMNNGGGGHFGANAGYYPTNGYSHQSQQKHFNQMPHQQFQMNNYKQNRFNGHGYHRGFERDHGRRMGHAQAEKHHSQCLNNGQVSSIAQGPGDAPTMLAQSHGDIKTVTPQSEAVNQVENAVVHGTQQSEADVASIEHERKPFDVSNGGPNEDVEQLSKVQSSNTKSINDSIRIEEDPREPSETVMHSADGSAGSQPKLAVNPHELLVTAVNVNNEASDILHPEFSAPLGPAAQFSASNSVDYYVRGTGSTSGPSRAMHTGRGRSRGRGSGSLGTTFSDYSSVVLEGNIFRTPQTNGHGVEGAPTGPRAMRDGLSVTGARGRGGFQITDKSGRQDLPITVTAVAESMNPHELEIHHSQSISRLQPHQHHRKRKSRSRSPIPSTDDTSEYERRGDHVHRRARQDRDVQSSDVKFRSRESTPESTSRSHTGHARTKHRSPRREHGHHRNKGRRRSKSPAESNLGSNDKENRSSESSRHHSVRDSTRKHINGTEKEKSNKICRRDRSESTQRDRDRRKRDRIHQDRHQNHQPSNLALPSRQGIEDHPLTREFKIKDRSKRTEVDLQKQLVVDPNPNIDPHTLEREARNRERLLKEEQRRNFLVAGISSQKRGGDALDDDTYSRTSKRKVRHERGPVRRERRTSYLHYESDEGKESRALRVETEREAARWI